MSTQRDNLHAYWRQALNYREMYRRHGVVVHDPIASANAKWLAGGYAIAERVFRTELCQQLEG